MTELRGLPLGAVPVVGPAETWIPVRSAGSAQDPGGRDRPPDPSRPSGTISLPCDTCAGTGKRPLECNTIPAADTPCWDCRGSGAVEAVWRVSPWDGHAHAFITPAGNAPSSAPRPCQHSAPTDRLSDDIDNAPKCVMCLIIVGDALADRVESSLGAMVDRQRTDMREEPMTSAG